MKSPNHHIFVLSVPAGAKCQHFSVSCTQSTSNPNLVAMQSKKISEQSADDMLYFNHLQVMAPTYEAGMARIKNYIIQGA